MIKVRFAPSPTGHLHIGGLRGAYYNYLFARQNHGAFVIRIEDTDFARNKDEYTQSIIDSFAWCGITSDEPIVKQSERSKLYQSYMQKLIDTDNAYWIDEPNEEGFVSKVLKLRSKKETGGAITFQDIVKGTITFERKEFDDFIIARSDGTPLYNFVVTIDDHVMGITHVIRGEEHLTNTPRQIMIYEALNVTIPQFAHLPLILGPDGKKLSKRDAATAVIDYKFMGFFPDALCMYLIRLGWAYGDQEYFTFDELLKLFDLKKVHTSGAIFDMNKLLSVNHHYMQQKSSEEIVAYVKNSQIFPFFTDYRDQEKLLKVIDLFKSRSKTLQELEDLCKTLLSNDILYNFSQESFKKDCATNIHLLPELAKTLESVKSDEQSITTWCDNSIKHYSLSKKDFFTLIRFALMNTTAAPSVPVMISLAGTQNTIQKINACFLLYQKQLSQES